jgi:hypothetical protein
MLDTHALKVEKLEDELRYIPLPRPEDVQGWLRVAYEAGLTAGLLASIEARPR